MNTVPRHSPKSRIICPTCDKERDYAHDFNKYMMDLYNRLPNFRCKCDDIHRDRLMVPPACSGCISLAVREIVEQWENE